MGFGLGVWVGMILAMILLWSMPFGECSSSYFGRKVCMAEGIKK